MQARNARVKVEYVGEKEEERSVMCIKAVVKRKGRDKSTERGSVHDEE